MTRHNISLNKMMNGEKSLVTFQTRRINISDDVDPRGLQILLSISGSLLLCACQQCPSKVEHGSKESDYSGRRDDTTVSASYCYVTNCPEA